MPTAHHDNPEILNWANEFVEMDMDSKKNGGRAAKLFYVWGHSFEFDRKDNWEHLDELCRMLAGKEDVWYATNMEIYEYVKAYDSLVFSADSRRVYNPTLKTVWFGDDGKLYQLEPGQTIITE